MRGFVLAQGQTLNGLGNKPVSDLIGTNVKLRWNGNAGTVKGDIKPVTEPWTQFDSTHPEQQTGHYFPFVFDEAYKGKNVTYKSYKGGDRKGKVNAEDATLIIRVENLNDKKVIMEIENERTITLDFSKANLMLPTGKDAFDAKTKDFSDWGSESKLYDGTITENWTGTKCKLTGKLKKASGCSKLEDNCYYVLIRLKKEFFENKDVTVGILNPRTLKEYEWSVKVTEESKKKPLIVKVGSQLIGEFDLTGLTLNGE